MKNFKKFAAKVVDAMQSYPGHFLVIFGPRKVKTGVRGMRDTCARSDPEPVAGFGPV